LCCIVYEMNGWNRLNLPAGALCAAGPEVQTRRALGGSRGGWRLLADVPN
jgi:hypothetical protein